jgi:ABC-2 type transport system ATP-binding protein
MIRVEKASLRYGDVEAVQGVSFSVAAGSMFGLVGSDGAGKTSLLRMIATMIQPSTGRLPSAVWMFLPTGNRFGI